MEIVIFLRQSRETDLVLSAARIVNRSGDERQQAHPASTIQRKVLGLAALNHGADLSRSLIQIRRGFREVSGDLKGGTSFQVYRPGKPLVDPLTKKTVGTEAFYLGTLKLNKEADASSPPAGRSGRRPPSA